MKTEKIFYLFIGVLIVLSSCKQKNSTLSIKADHDDADIYLNGEVVGTTPIDIKVATGNYKIEIKKENEDKSYYYNSKELVIAENTTKPIDFKLEVVYTENYHWYKAKDGESIEDLESYITKFPHGKYINLVKETREEIYWNKARTGDNLDNIEVYLHKYPQGRFVDLVDEVKEDIYWNKALNSTTDKDIDVYLEKFPNGKYKNNIEEARENILFNKIENASLVGVAKKNYYLYKEKYPSGDFIEEAERIANSFTGTFKDSRDGQTYKWVKIGNQIWLAENLNYESAYSKATYIEVEDGRAIRKRLNGRTYTWNAAMKACPSGWHLPSRSEWMTLINYLGGKKNAGGKLKSTHGWRSPNVGANNISGFTGLPKSNEYKSHISYWTSSSKGDREAYYTHLNNDETEISVGSWYKNQGRNTSYYAIRCIQN
jgi:uncharacterized protein (TIGR02145 family)